MPAAAPNNLRPGPRRNRAPDLRQESSLSSLGFRGLLGLYMSTENLGPEAVVSIQPELCKPGVLDLGSQLRVGGLGPIQGECLQFNMI